MRVFNAVLLLTAAAAKKMYHRHARHTDLIDLASEYSENANTYEPIDFWGEPNISPEYDHPEKIYCCGDCDEGDDDEEHYEDDRTDPQDLIDIASSYTPGRTWEPSDFRR